MRKLLQPFCLLLALGFGAAVRADSKSPAAAAIDFNRDIRPIFSDTCFKCHGFDHSKRKADLRLDVAEGAYAVRDGHAAIVPGDLARSEAWRRINATNSDDLMPPADSGIKLTARQIQLLGDWIRQGAKYEKHWSFIPPRHSPLPKVRKSSWVKNGIDAFILARLEEEHLSPSREADKPTLIRRVTFDLTGLPPTLAEVDAFVADKSRDAYEKVVDRLLASPHYGERMAVDWLDAARFADTHGYHIDSGRDMTHWRKWVIDAFNNDMPFDRFTIEQLAGDLLPDATVDQKIASGFNRNNMINFEGGAIAEEYLAAYMIDRVNTTSAVWLGLTVACAQCHDHKYDPITQKDYYQLFAFFNHVPEKGLDGAKGNAEPLLPLPSPEQAAKQAKLKADAERAEKYLKHVEEMLPREQTEWEEHAGAIQPNEPPGILYQFSLDETLDGRGVQGMAIPGSFHGTNVPSWTDGKVGRGLALDGATNSFVSAQLPVNFERTNAFSCGCWVKLAGQKIGALFARMDEAHDLRGYDLLLDDNHLFFHLIHSWPKNALRVKTREPLPKDKWTHVFATYDGSGKAAGVKLYVNGTEAPVEVLDDKLDGSIANDTTFNIGKRSASAPFKGSLDDVRIYGRVLSPAEIVDLADAPVLGYARLAPEARSKEQKEELTQRFRDHHYAAWPRAKQALEDARKARDEFEKTIPTTMVMAEMEKPRDTFVLLRGQYDKHGDKVTPAVPESLPPLPAGAPANRLGLAEWLVSPAQPLTARVTVNRFWQMYFGTGLVKTTEDFGSQGEWPSHPELLDWLATEFTQNGWDVKRLQKLIVMSATYRQSSFAAPELVAKDPENRLLARGPRFRLQAEFIRDQALAISGLLNDEIDGKSVSPYQPAGLWEELASREDGKNWTAQTYTQDHGADLYRRTMYTFWKRTSPPPTLATFDAPDRETCTVRRPRTNTPLQALVLLNDPTYVEASRKLAERMIAASAKDKERIAFAFRLATARAPRSAELAVLQGLYERQLAAFRANPSAALKLLGVGEAPRNETLDAADLAAWTMVAGAILNLDETVTKG